MKAHRLLLAALLLAAASARAGSAPDNVLDACAGGEGAVHVAGWAYDPDASSESIGIHVRLYTDPDCENPYGDAHALTADVPRPDMNQAKGITGDHGFDADIPVADAGTYWVKVFAIDATGDGNAQIGATTSVTVTAPVPPPRPDCTVTVTKFHQSYPYSGRATVEYTIGGTLPEDAVVKIIVRTDDATATFVQSNVVAGAHTNVIDFAPAFGGAQLLANATFVVAIPEEVCDGVQLWEDGPYWAECNVGAATPEGYGYYFWWGDTVGYRRENNAWVAADGSTSNFSFENTAVPTNGKDNSALQSAGYIDSTTNLVAAHDAATAHLGAPWRMPTSDELNELRSDSNCTTTWGSRNGVFGRLVTGKGAYADKSIFLPAAGYGRGSSLNGLGTDGYYWSSTPVSSNSGRALDLYFASGSIYRNEDRRYDGISVRPVRLESALCSADGTVTYDDPPPASGYEAWAAANGVAGAWDATDASGVHNVFRYAFDKPTGEITNPPLLDIAIEGGNAVVKTPPVVNAEGFAVSVVESSDIAGKTVTRRRTPDATGRAVFAMGGAASRFYRLAAAELGGVQLWEGGPYWAECNVGASAPEEYGYYFWWGDTVGYVNDGRRSPNGNYHEVTWTLSTGEQLDDGYTPLKPPTYGKDNAALLAEGYIDATSNLAAAHDAATANLGSPWRMPTDAELSALHDNCDATWITTNEVPGILFTGRGDYAGRSIFLPAAGYGIERHLCYPDSRACVWSSTPGASDRAWIFQFYSGGWAHVASYRNYVVPVRPVRDPTD